MGIGVDSMGIGMESMGIGAESMGFGAESMGIQQGSHFIFKVLRAVVSIDHDSGTKVEVFEES